MLLLILCSSSRVGSAKLLLQSVPALRGEKFILALDADTILLEGIASLWKWTRVLREKRALWALVQEHSDGTAAISVVVRRQNASHVVDPPYFNTGVMLIHAQLLRDRGLLQPSNLMNQLSSSVRADRGYIGFGLGDQNLLNAYLSEHPDAATVLPCQWNRRSDSGVCDDAGLGVLHANRKVGRTETARRAWTRLKLLLPTTNLTDVAHLTDKACRQANFSSGSVGEECTELTRRLWVHNATQVWHSAFRSLLISGTCSGSITDACLSGSIACELKATCDASRVYPRSCLTTRIPAWVATTTRVQCCMRCCLLYWLQRLGLDANTRHWMRMKKRFDISSGTGSEEHGQRDVSADLPIDSVLLFRFSLARFAHVQALTLEDWSALVKANANVRSPRFSAPSAPFVKEALVCLNGFGHLPKLRRVLSLNATQDLSGITNLTILHSATPPGGHRIVFADPLDKIFRGALSENGSHAVLYGDDTSLSNTSMVRIRRQLGASLAHYYAPNLSPDALRLPFTSAMPLGLNSGGYHVALNFSLMARTLGMQQQTSRHHGRNTSLLCCCMRMYDHRHAVVAQLVRAGFDCGRLNDGTYSWEQTVAMYSRHRFVLDIYGRGKQDFRVWEILLAGAVPVIQYFAEQDTLLEGLPVVRVSNWSELTPARLGIEWNRIQRGVDSGSLSWTKAYLPFWFHRFVAHMQPGVLV